MQKRQRIGINQPAIQRTSQITNKKALAKEAGQVLDLIQGVTIDQLEAMLHTILDLNLKPLIKRLSSIELKRKQSGTAHISGSSSPSSMKVSGNTN
ncbi:hypothetical protein NDU88_003953 [Pleurodeles waltl]|uniref:Uncharacterized protein n=1 Tax=Pleurodeles waltl TaxID=8319 RepID=A0AAV7WQW5_PLEWA|nr:hypothetical protein NDU88_003953 [Pleurodeles waltl]